VLSFGPLLIIFPASIKNNRPKSRYKPIKPSKVKSVLPAETVGDAPSEVRNKL
jgi:hypothetical protein